MRFRIEPRDVPPEHAAKRLGLSLAEFKDKLPSLLARGFPSADPDTGNHDLEAINRWCDARHPHLFGQGADTTQARDARMVAGERIERLKEGWKR